MSKTVINRKGYKKTKIGMIPEDWEVVKLGEKIKLISGQHIESHLYNNEKVGIPYLTGPNDYPNGIIQATKYTEHPKVKCNKDDILITCKGSGTGSLTIADQPYCISRQIMAIRPINTNSHFIFSILKQEEKSLGGKAVGLIPGISRDDILKIPIPLPPLPEQKKIAVILSTWDEAIEMLESLVALKEKRKKGLMQSLLTGKKRLKGFYSNWIEYYLGDLFDERIEIGFNKLPLVSVTRDRGIVFRNMEDQKDTSSEDKSKYLHICPGDIGYNTMRMWQGVSGLSEIEGIVSPAYTILKPQKNVHGLFFQYLFKFPSMINYFYRHSQGLVSDTLNLKYSNFKKIKAFIPPLPEQKRIAEVLNTADNEINLHKEEIEKIKLQKKGLMQKLLTGKVRVTK